MNSIHRILVPTDFSPQAETAARYAIELAATTGAVVTLFNVYALPVAIPFPDGSAIIPSPEMLAEVATRAEAALRDLRARLQRPQLELETASIEGSPREAIARYAQHQGYDLVVMGTHGRTGLGHLMLGSVAESVVRTSTCPVLTVPSKSKKGAAS